MAYLVFVRHGQSEWNALGLWTGQKDVPLTEQGREEARKAAEGLRDITLHKAYTSKLARAKETLREIKEALGHVGQADLETVEHEALNERHYGDYTAKNKWEIKEAIGEEEFTKLRRTWDHPVPGGETLKDVHARALPYYEEHILQDLKQGKNVIVAAHGNTLRALMKHLEEVADDDVHQLEIGTGEVMVYEIDEHGKVLDKQLRTAGGKA
ncbi:MAG TPA: 2,3-diphosphoglycerate-dependent phosphoglycerate mutase [Candidatus Saccharimonadales bacterium]|nr:2,3-diphosphoglycerate-dependent phosphoglycerate mutase [Candidatus Saccharimonadales bacterium]